jgi:hypothetical protein
VPLTSRAELPPWSTAAMLMLSYLLTAALLEGRRRAAPALE